ncbi:MAG: MarR family transcriptional regulator [Oscillospiraceae bacterium]|nr:MarR family transcriptional regulator [Oscillospiraceae bacterium]
MEERLPIGLRFSLLHRAFRRRMDALLSEKELTGVQFGVLMALVHMEKEGAEEISQRALEERARVSHATMAEILKRLEKKGFIRSEQSQRDKRYKSIRATDKAYRLKGEMAEVGNETFAWLCRGMSSQQVEDLLGSVDLMLCNAWQEKQENKQEGGEKTCDQDLRQVHP